MVVRTPELDRARYPNLPHLKYPFGGTMGTGVRSGGAHLSHVLAHAGKDGRTAVKEGDALALTGTSGNAAGEPPHLHFEVWTKRNVGAFPDGRISPGEVPGFLYDNMDNRIPNRNVG